MKYFKPELLARCRALDDEVAEAAAQEWEDAIAAYQTRFNAISHKLPEEARSLCSRFTLHDARMLGAAFGTEQALFVILLQLESAGGNRGKALELSYIPVAGPNSGVIVKTHGAMQ